MIVGALIHEAGTVIQAPKPVCQFMAEDIPPPVLNPYPTTTINSTSHKVPSQPSSQDGGGWGCEVSCGGHHRPRGKTTTGSALDGAVFDITQILAYLVHNMSRSQLYLGFGHFG